MIKHFLKKIKRNLLIKFKKSLAYSFFNQEKELNKKIKRFQILSLRNLKKMIHAWFQHIQLKKTAKMSF